MNSFGSIDKIVIKNSFQDAIDFDFSDLKVNELKLKAQEMIVLIPLQGNIL